MVGGKFHCIFTFDKIMKRGKNNFFGPRKPFLSEFFLVELGVLPPLCRKNALSSIWQLPLTSCHFYNVQCILDLLSNHLASQIRFISKVQNCAFAQFLLGVSNIFVSMSKWLTQDVCYVNVLAGPIFSLLPVSNHVQVRRVARGQIIPVRAGFVQDTQLPLFSPNSLCCSCLFCWSNHWWAAELGRFYQSLSEYWVPPPPLSPPSSAKWMLSTAVHYHLPTTTGYNCPNCPQKVQLCVQDPGVSLPTTCIWTKTGQKGF